jgi:hypothetical protein
VYLRVAVCFCRCPFCAHQQDTETDHLACLFLVFIVSLADSKAA